MGIPIKPKKGSVVAVIQPKLGSIQATGVSNPEAINPGMDKPINPELVDAVIKQRYSPTWLEQQFPNAPKVLGYPSLRVPGEAMELSVGIPRSLVGLGEMIGEGRGGEIPGSIVKGLGATINAYAKDPASALQRPISALLDASVLASGLKVPKVIGEIPLAKDVSVATKVGDIASMPISGLTGVSRDLVKNKLSRTLESTIWSGEQGVKDIGKGIKTAVNDSVSEYAKQSSLEQKALKNVKGEHNFYTPERQAKSNEMLDSRLYTDGEEVLGIPQDELLQINKFEKSILNATAEKANKVKHDIDEYLGTSHYKTHADGKIIQRSGITEQVLKNMRASISEKLEQLAPKTFAEANAKVSAINDALRTVKSKLDMANPGKQVLNAVGDPELAEALKILSESMPGGKQFFQKLIDAKTQQEFAKPMGNINNVVGLGVPLTYAAYKSGIPALAGLGLATSPLATGKALEGIALASKGIKGISNMPGQRYMTPVGLLNQQSVLKSALLATDKTDKEGLK